ncbi:MAG: transcriptional repressor [Alphaproteobacteria bacterium]|nr:transcriptional repressor [Alphaproteobacteria bacterium]
MARSTPPARSFASALNRLRAAGLRPTRQRLALAKTLFDKGPRHVTAEALHAEALDAQMRVSLATVYNTLHQFVRVGLLREVMVDPGRSYFDTNVADHHHFWQPDSARLTDIPPEHVVVSRIPAPPLGTEVGRVDVVVRLRSKKGK